MARAGRWATVAVGRGARLGADVGAELGCDWHTVTRAVVAWSEALLAADCDRVGAVEALDLDETLFGRTGPWRARWWCTSVVDVAEGQLLDLSGAYRRAFDVALPHAGDSQAATRRRCSRPGMASGLIKAPWLGVAPITGSVMALPAPSRIPSETSIPRSC